MGALLPLCFIISGASSLILQVVWVRKLVEIFGSSTLAIATVLASFMGGLALGAAIGGRLADRFGSGTARGKDDPFLYYGVAEAIVGLSALVIPIAIAAFRGPNAWLWTHLGDTPSALALARFVLTAGVLLIPTTAMGATLPLLARRVTARSGELGNLGRHLGTLYAANTLGAVLGAAIAGFALVPAVGAHASGQIAAFLAIGLAAFVALAVARSAGRQPSELDRAIASPSASPRASSTERRLALLAYALSGAVAMSLEVLFSRALAIINGSSVTSFTLVLVVFLAGISLGAAAISKIADRTDRPLALLGGLLVAAAAAIAFAVYVIDDLPAISANLLESTRLEASAIVSVHAAITALTIAPVSIFLGAIMPVAIRAYVGSPDRVGREVGIAYAANTVGAIVGSVATGFVLMPALTIETTLRGLVLVDALMGLVLVIYARKRSANRRNAIIWAATAIVVLVGIFAPPWSKSDFTAGIFRTHIAKAAIVSGLRERAVVYYKDGAATTVTVEKLRSGVVVLKNNGKAEASNRVDMPTQILIGLIPVLLHGDQKKDVFVVGYGSGVTVGAIATSPAVERLDVAELEPAVYEAADAHFSDINRAPQDDPRVHRLIGDGRNVLLAGGRKYDLIASEPSNPWIAGVASLFTREFYAFARRHLKPGGIFCQWAQLYELGPANVKMIYRTFAESFPYVYAFTPGDEVTDTVLIGSLQPIDLSPARIATIIDANPTIRAELDRASISRAEDLIAAAFLLPDEIAAFTAGAAINTDDNGKLEYQAPRDLLLSAERGSVARMVRSPGWPYGRLADVIAPGAGDAAMARALLEYGRRTAGRTFLDRASESAEKDDVALLFELSRPREFADPELTVTAGGAPLAAPSSDLFVGTDEAREAARENARAAYPLIANGEWEAADRKLEALPATVETDAGRDMALLRGYIAYKAIEFARARSLLSTLATDKSVVRRRPAILYYLGRSQYGAGSFRSGIATLATFATDHADIAEIAKRDPFAAPKPETVNDDKLTP